MQVDQSRLAEELAVAVAMEAELAVLAALGDKCCTGSSRNQAAAEVVEVVVRSNISELADSALVVVQQSSNGPPLCRRTALPRSSPVQAVARLVAAEGQAHLCHAHWQICGSPLVLLRLVL